MFSWMIALIKVKLQQNQEVQRKGSMHIWITNPPMRMIRRLHSSTSPTQGGKQMFASFKNTILTMESTVMGLKPSNWLRRNQNWKKIRKQKSLDQNLEKNSLKVLKRHNHGIKSMPLLKTFPTVPFQNPMTTGTLMVLTSPTLLETKELAALATQFHLPRLLNHDLSLDMVRNNQCFHHST